MSSMDQTVDRTVNEVEPPVTLSIITIVRNDLPGLTTSCDSLEPILADDVEHVIVDGSTESDVPRFFVASAHGKTSMDQRPRRRNLRRNE